MNTNTLLLGIQLAGEDVRAASDADLQLGQRSLHRLLPLYRVQIANAEAIDAELSRRAGLEDGREEYRTSMPTCRTEWRRLVHRSPQFALEARIYTASGGARGEAIHEYPKADIYLTAPDLVPWRPHGRPAPRWEFCLSVSPLVSVRLLFTAWGVRRHAGDPESDPERVHLEDVTPWSAETFAATPEWQVFADEAQYLLARVPR